MSTLTQKPTASTTSPARSARVAPLYRLAWRNLWRQRRRTTLLIIVVTYATLAIIFFWGFTDGFLDSIINGQARYINAPGVIVTERYYEDPDPENALPVIDELAAIALAHPDVRGVAPRLEFPALLRSPYATEGAMVRGIDPAREPQVSNIPGDVTDGRMLTQAGEVVLGRKLAERLDVRLGERLAMDVASVAGPQAAGLILVGTVDSGVSFIDETAVLVHLDDARTLTGVPTATALALDIRRGQEERVARDLQAELPEGIAAYGVRDLLGPLQRGLASERAQTLPLGLIFSLFAAVTVTSTVVVSVMERTREFGVMIALGLAPARLAWQVTLEAVLATGLGWLLGLALGYGLLWVMATWNVMGPLFNDLYGSFLGNLGLSDEIYTSISAEYLVYASLTIALAALFSALVPAGRVRGLNPSEAMRAE